MEKYDEVKVGCDPDVLDKKYQKREKMHEFQAKLYRYAKLLTSTNIIISTIALSLFCVYVLPELCYAFACMDRHLAGIFHEPEPYYARTTANQKYYS